MLKRDNHCLTLLRGKNKSKAEKIFVLLGDLDELNANLGLVRAFSRRRVLKGELRKLQGDLIEIGGFLAGFKKDFNLKMKISNLEERILKLEDSSVKEFSRPGVNKTSTCLHLSRAVCRRVERGMVHLRHQSLVKYFNRLSLLLFWLAVKEEKR